MPIQRFAGSGRIIIKTLILRTKIELEYLVKKRIISNEKNDVTYSEIVFTTAVFNEQFNFRPR